MIARLLYGVSQLTSHRSLKSTLSALVLLLVAGFAAHTLAAEGVWLTEGGKSQVEIRACGDKLCGKIVWLEEPSNEDGSPKLDKHNKNESLRSRPILGIELLTGLPAAEGGEWTGGETYNPENGKTYRSELELEGANTLKVRGCVFSFCETQTWARVR